jgi:hypothetical protein
MKPKIDWFKNPITMEDHLARIEALSERILGHVRFIASVNQLAGTSGEAKHKAVGSFYTCLATMERALSRIGNDIRLG